MGSVIPRWEWRTFGSRFGAANEFFAPLAPSAVQESDELYLLAGGEANVKVRDELMDIKLLRETDAAGLQRWEPALKAAFPLDARQAEAVFVALDRPAPSAPTMRWSLDELLAELGGSDSPVRAVPVQKRRVRYEVLDCAAEVTEVRSGEVSTRTVAIESTDADAVSRARRALGLQDYLNVSYPAGLADLIDRIPGRYAVIDVGTNSVKAHLAEQSPDGRWRTVLDRAEVTRLGEGLAERGTISDEALERTAAAVTAMAGEARQRHVRAISAVGTAGLRSASNRDAVIDAIRTRSGIHVQLISGEEESRLAYRAVAAGVGLGQGSVVVFDTGGGSSQFTFGKDGRVDDRFSLDIGAVRVTERFGLDASVSEAAIEHACEAIAGELGRLRDRARADLLVGMGGAITNLTSVALGLASYDGEAVDGTRLERAELDRQIELYRRMDADARRSIVGLQPKRAEVILAGACIVRTVMVLLGHDALTVSDRGLRHGVLDERFGMEVTA